MLLRVPTMLTAIMTIRFAVGLLEITQILATTFIMSTTSFPSHSIVHKNITGSVMSILVLHTNVCANAVMTVSFTAMMMMTTHLFVLLFSYMSVFCPCMDKQCSD